MKLAGILLGCVAAVSIVPATAAAAGSEPTPWVAELRGGWFQPDLPDYGEFYGRDRSGYFAAAFAYQLRRWLEVGAEVGYMRDTGTGLQSGNSQPGGSVKYTLVPAHLYVTLLGKWSDTQLFVPYAGAGLSYAYYRQKIESQSNRDGTSDLGYNARAGVQLLLNRLDPRTARRVSPHGEFQAYAFAEVQWFTADTDAFDLGGVAYLLGIRFEWGPGQSH